jgi:hypothetical protein
MTNYQKACAEYFQAARDHEEVKLALYAGRIGYDEYSASVRRFHAAEGWCIAVEDAELRADQINPLSPL